MTAKAADTFLAEKAVVLGPMAGITEAPFRGICKSMGASLTFTEMISAKGLHYNPDSRAASALLTLDPAEVPCAVQLFGGDPALMAEQAARLAEKLGDAVCLLDINMGCPVPKVVGKGEGCALMLEPEQAARITSAVAQASSLPVSVKFRAGWDSESISAVDFALEMQAAGASMVTVHGRTRQQHYRGKADWRVIAAVKAAVNIPVVGSGDVFSADDAAAMFEQTGVDGVMIARGALGNPWIFREARGLIDRGERFEPPTGTQRIEVARAHARALVEFGGERAVARMRKHVAWYIQGLPEARRIRGLVNGMADYASLDALLAEYQEFLRSSSAC
ncbi:MAG: tRNA dihydrouridine synthase DusB [Actinobacteria bacterium]|nr:tRNA dihydrouridine synthase DusB [Actinomycetota bacterium]MCL5887708.1 tRNA dihydrouridine synthase DusB [Actinomycetota bacterium]